MSYTIKREEYNESTDFSTLVELLKITFPKAVKFSAEYKKWQYADNPEGEAISFNAYDGDKLIAHYGTIPIKMMIEGEIHKGLLSLDTATHPDYRGKGLFTALALETYEFAKKQGFEFVIGVANANSTPGFLKKLGFYQVSPLDFKVGFGNIFGKKKCDKNHIAYSEDWLKWRLSSPFFRYRKKNGVIYGERKEPLFSTVAGLVPEGLIVPEMPRSSNGFRIYIGLGIDKPSGCYINLPKFVKRSPFNLIFKDLTEENLPYLTKDNTFFQLMDFDVA